MNRMKKNTTLVENSDEKSGLPTQCWRCGSELQNAHCIHPKCEAIKLMEHNTQHNAFARAISIRQAAKKILEISDIYDTGFREHVYWLKVVEAILKYKFDLEANYKRLWCEE